MKKTKFALWLTAVAVCGMVVTGCKDDKPTPGPDPDPDPDPELVDPSSIAAGNLVAYFNFEDNGNDQIGGLTPSKETGTSYVTGRRGKAYQGVGSAGASGVAGDPSYLVYNLPEASKIKNLKAFTTAMWVKVVPTTDGGPEPMIFQVDGTTDWVWGNLFLLQHRNGVADGTPKPATFENYFWKDDSETWKGQRIGNINSSLFSFNTWQHFIVTYDNVTSKWAMYLDGTALTFTNSTTGDDETAAFAERWQSAGGTPLGDLKFNAPTSLTIGAWAAVAAGTESGAWAGFYKGGLDEFRIYDRALTSAEAKQLYDAEVENMN